MLVVLVVLPGLRLRPLLLLCLTPPPPPRKLTVTWPKRYNPPPFVLVTALSKLQQA